MVKRLSLFWFGLFLCQISNAGILDKYASLELIYKETEVKVKYVDLNCDGATELIVTSDSTSSRSQSGNSYQIYNDDGTTHLGTIWGWGYEVVRLSDTGCLGVLSTSAGHERDSRVQWLRYLEDGEIKKERIKESCDGPSCIRIYERELVNLKYESVADDFVEQVGNIADFVSSSVYKKMQSEKDHVYEWYKPGPRIKDPDGFTDYTPLFDEELGRVVAYWDMDNERIVQLEKDDKGYWEVVHVYKDVADLKASTTPGATKAAERK